MWFWNLTYYFGLIGTVVMLSALIGELLKEPTDYYHDNIAMGITSTLVFGILPLAVGYIQRKRLKRILQEEEKAQRTTDLLRLAQSNKGVLTLTDVSLGLGLSIEDARNILDEAVIKGICQIEFDEKGSLQYIFPDLVSN